MSCACKVIPFPSELTKKYENTQLYSTETLKPLFIQNGIDIDQVGRILAYERYGSSSSIISVFVEYNEKQANNHRVYESFRITIPDGIIQDRRRMRASDAMRRYYSQRTFRLLPLNNA